MPYIRRKPGCDAEQAVRNAGYFWTQTNPLESPVYRQTELPDHLDMHRHNSCNTHVIVDGTLIIRAVGHSFPLTISTDIANQWQEVAINPQVSYEAYSGLRGAVFVEGHAKLSPTTAGRFEERHTIHWRDDGTGRPTHVQKADFFAQQAAMQDPVLDNVRFPNGEPLRRCII